MSFVITNSIAIERLEILALRRQGHQLSLRANIDRVRDFNSYAIRRTTSRLGTCWYWMILHVSLGCNLALHALSIELLGNHVTSTILAIISRSWPRPLHVQDGVDSDFTILSSSLKVH